MHGHTSTVKRCLGPRIRAERIPWQFVCMMLDRTLPKKNTCNFTVDKGGLSSDHPFFPHFEEHRALQKVLRYCDGFGLPTNNNTNTKYLVSLLTCQPGVEPNARVGANTRSINECYTVVTLLGCQPTNPQQQQIFGLAAHGVSQDLNQDLNQMWRWTAVSSQGAGSRAANLCKQSRPSHGRIGQ